VPTKLTSENQLALPKAATGEIPGACSFEARAEKRLLFRSDKVIE
jgi:hypothetical protein